MRTFDVSVAKVAVYLHVIGTKNCVSVTTEETENDIKSGVFTYQVHPCLEFKHHISRILKYVRKGFTLKAFVFSHLCSDEYKYYVMKSFAHMYRPRLIKEMFPGKEGCVVDILDVTVSRMLGVNNTLSSKFGTIEILCANAATIIQNNEGFAKRQSYFRNTFARRVRLQKRLETAQTLLARWFRRYMRVRRDGHGVLTGEDGSITMTL